MQAIILHNIGGYRIFLILIIFLFQDFVSKKYIELYLGKSLISTYVVCWDCHLLKRAKWSITLDFWVFDGTMRVEMSE